MSIPFFDDGSRPSPYADNRCIGVCHKVTEWHRYACPNDLYVLKTKRYKLVDGVSYTRRVLSFGLIFRSYGRSFDLPLGRWQRE